MKKITLSFVLLALLGCHSNFLGLKKSDTNTDGSALPRQTGCLAGVVLDGITGARIDLAAEGKSDNFFVLVSDAQRYAGPLLSDGDAAEYPNLVGEYTLCDVPVESEFPLYVSVPGYQTFESVVLIESSDAAQGAGAEQDVLSQVPTKQANIRLFPLAPPGKDYQVFVSFNGAPLEGAAVQLEPTGGHVTAPSNANFLDPVTTGYKTLKGTTDANGLATFAAADLALGALYQYLVLPVDASLQTAGVGSVSVGYVTDAVDPYVLHVDLPQVNSELVIVSQSTENNNPSPDGSISFVFNRPIELVPDSADGAVAVLSGAVTAALAANVPANKLSEQVDIAISGQVLTLTPKFKTNPDAAKEGALGISYSGVLVRPTVGQKLLQQLEASGTVKFYGGQNGAAPAQVVAFQGNNQSADPGDALADPIVAKVTDIDGNPLSGISVGFAVTSGDGTLTTATVQTDAQGLAETEWTLGATGTQTVEATVAGLATAATFTATFTIANLTYDAGDGQTGLSTAPLATPLSVIATDANNDPVVGGEVTFTVADATNGGKVRAVDDTGAGNTTVTVLTDANGKAEATWVMGTTPGTYTTNASAGTATDVPFSATYVTATLALVSTNNQTQTHGMEIPLPLIVLVTDGTIPLQNIDVRFTTNDTAGAVGAMGAEMLDTVVVQTDVNGHAQVYWLLGTDTGAQTVVAHVEGTTIPADVTFSATSN